MSISFHCEACGKKIKAPESAGGKWGNCPACRHRCYIPMLIPDDAPPLTLKPVDQSEESRLAQMMKETHSVTQFILHENEPVDDGPDEGAGVRSAEEKDVIKTCILYLRQMADGDLMIGDQTLERLRPHKKTALRVLASMARAERPEPELADLPDRVLRGLVQDASAKLSR
jgi:hypothetical protein